MRTRDPESCAIERAILRELRCDCGSLLARLIAGEIELKCRRCKRVLTLRLDGEERRPEAGCGCQAHEEG